MLRIGLTGGIGSGKTTVAGIFKLVGVPVYDADQRAKELMDQDMGLKNKVKSLFGQQAYLNDSGLNRSFIAEKVFGNDALLDKLNSIVHPAVRDDFRHWSDLKSAGLTEAPYLLYEAALIVETGFQQQLDGLITVFAPQEERIKRVMQRDGSTREEVTTRISHQTSDQEKMKVTDFLVINDGKHLLVPQVMEMDLQIKSRTR